MRHLKLFEGYLDEPTYYGIEREEGMDLIETQTVNMSDRTADRILKIFGSVRVITGGKDRGSSDSSFYVTYTIPEGYQFIDISIDTQKTTRPSSGRNIEIVEIEDGWFVMRIHGGSFKSNIYKLKSYKCDGIDGVKKCLEENKILKILK